MKKKALGILAIICCLTMAACGQGSTVTQRSTAATQGSTASAGESTLAGGENGSGAVSSSPAESVNSSAEAPSSSAAQTTPPIVEQGPIVTDSEAYCVIDDTGTILLEQNADLMMAPASITKVLTALVVVEHMPLDAVTTISQNAVDRVDLVSSGVAPSLKCGEQMTIGDLLYALMLPSTNSAGNVLAEAVGGSIENFVAMMNGTKDRLGCANSNFMNPHGLDEDGHYVTAYDMCLILRAAMQNPQLAQILGTISYTIPATTMAPERYMTMGHQMVTGAYYYPIVTGGKTGWTVNAQATMVTAANADGKNYYVCTLKADQGGAYVDTKNIIEYCRNQESLLTPLVSDFRVSAITSEGVDVSWTVENADASVRFVYWDDAVGTAGAVTQQVNGTRGSMTIPLNMKVGDCYVVQVFAKGANGDETALGNRILYTGDVLFPGINQYAGSSYYAEKSGFLGIGWLETTEGAFYANEKGILQHGLLNGGKAMFYLNEEGHPIKGWMTIEGNQYYFQADGRMATGDMMIDGVAYHFNEAGCLVQ